MNYNIFEKKILLNIENIKLKIKREISFSLFFI